MRLLAVLLVAFGALALSLPRIAAAAAAEKVSYKPPVDGPIVDPYRPPPEPWSAGNRGIDYAPGVGAPVKAAADGEVTFAGQVGGDLHVVILHADGVRTSYSFLDSIAVHRGDKVRQGQVIGTSGEDLHFGARVGDDYIDPRTLFDGPPQVFLVPDEVRKAGTESQERSGLTKFLGGIKKVVGLGVGAVGSFVRDRVDQVRGIAEAVSSLTVWPHAIGLISTVVDWWKQRSDCTPASVQPPPLQEPRIAVLVGGLGSSTDNAAIFNLDTTGLGYPLNVHFSYTGGDATYTPEDTTVDIRTSAQRLRELLEQVEHDHPGVPVDIFAHSQGGLVARAALAYEDAADRTLMPAIGNLVTFGSPHQGADLGTAATNVGHTPVGNLAFRALDATHTTPWDLGGASVRELAEHSDFIRDLNNRRLPDGIRFTSIGSRTDPIVPAIHTSAPGARNVVVDVPGFLDDHSRLPGSAEGRREAGLAIVGMAPTCRSFGDMMADTIVSDAIATTEDVAGLGLAGASAWLSGVR